MLSLDWPEKARNRLGLAAGVLLVAGAGLLLGPWQAWLVVGALIAAILVVMRPEAGTLLGTFVLYSNLMVLAFRLHGAPRALALSFLILFGLPLIYHLFYKKEPVVLDRIFFGMCALLLIAVASTAISVDPASASEWLFIYVTEGLITFWMVVNVIRSRVTLERVLTVLLCTGALLGILSLYQAITKDYRNEFFGLAQRNLNHVETDAEFGIRPEEHVRLSHRAGGPLQESNYFAQMLLVLVPFGVYRMGRTQGLRRFWSFLLLGAILVGIVLTYSRGGFLALLILVGLMLYFRQLRLRTLLIGLLMALLLTGAIAPGYFNRLASLAAVSNLTSSEQGQQLDSAIAGRATEMAAATAVFLDHPFLGVGPGLYSPYYSVEYQANSDWALLFVDRTRRAHSLYLEMGAELGVLGLGVFLVMMGSLLTGLMRLRRSYLWVDPDSMQLATAGLLSMCAYLSTSIFLQLAYQRYPWFLIALIAAIMHILKKEMPQSQSVGEVVPSLVDGSGVSNSRGVDYV